MSLAPGWWRVRPPINRGPTKKFRRPSARPVGAGRVEPAALAAHGQPGGFRPQAPTQRLEGYDVVGRDVAEVDVDAEVPDEPPLLGPRRRLEDDAFRADPVEQRADQRLPHCSVRPVEPDGARFAALGDDEGGAGVEIA